MPDSWSDACAEFMGVEPLPHTPLAGYLARLSSMMYVVHGATLFVVARNMPQSLFMVKPLGGAEGRYRLNDCAVVWECMERLDEQLAFSFFDVDKTDGTECDASA
jgi:hypothetical protein